MKLAYGSVPVKALNINYFEQNTNDCDMIASDLQAGKTAVARGQKIVGTGKSFEFAFYGMVEANDIIPVPNNINVVEVACMTHPVQLSIELSEMKNIDFSLPQTVGSVIVDGVSCPITVQVEYNILTIGCPASVRLQIFYGKDNYI